MTAHFMRFIHQNQSAFGIKKVSDEVKRSKSREKWKCGFKKHLCSFS